MILPPQCVKTLSYELPCLSPTFTNNVTTLRHSWIPDILLNLGLAIGEISWTTAALNPPVPSEIGRPRWFREHFDISASRDRSEFADRGAAGLANLGVDFVVTMPPAADVPAYRSLVGARGEVAVVCLSTTTRDRDREELSPRSSSRSKVV